MGGGGGGGGSCGAGIKNKLIRFFITVREGLDDTMQAIELRFLLYAAQSFGCFLHHHPFPVKTLGVSYSFE